MRLERRVAPVLATFVVMLAAVPVRNGYSAPAPVASPLITTYAGGVGEGAASTISMFPSGVAVRGNRLYIVDRLYNAVRELDLTNGHIRVVAGSGSRSGFAGDGGPATGATFNFGDQTHNGAAVDGAGNLYIADRANHRVRKVDTAGIVTTYAGTGTSGWTGDGGPATAAQLMDPTGLATDSAGNVYIAGGAVVRKVSTAGVITTVAGLATSDSFGDGGPATAAGIGAVVAVAVDGTGNLFLSDSFHGIVRRVDPSGVITTYAGGGTGSSVVDGALATEAYLSWPAALAVDSAGGLYIALGGETRVVRVDPGTRRVRVVAADLNAPLGVAVDGAGNLYVADSQHFQVRRVDPSGTTTTVAGNPGLWRYSGEGVPAAWAQLYLEVPGGLAFDKAGNLYVSDPMNHRVRKVDRAGVITAVAGTGVRGLEGDWGPATEAEMIEPGPLAVDPDGNLYIHDFWTAQLRKVDTNGIITTVFEDRYADYVPGSKAISSMAVDGAGNFYFTMGSIIRKRNPAGEYSIFAGNNVYGFSGDGGPAANASLVWPAGLAVDGAGNVYVGDLQTMRVRRIDTAGIITTVAGNGSPWAAGDGGPATNAGLYPGWIAVDREGVLYIADSAAGHRIRRVDRSGIITTVAGAQNRGYAGDGGPASESRVDNVSTMATDADGNLYLSDVGNFRIRAIWFGSPPPPTTVPPPPPPTTTSTSTSSSTTTTTRVPTTTSSTTSTTTTTTVPVSRRYVERAVRDVLGRAPDTAEVATSGSIATKADRERFALSLVGSVEYRKAVVGSYFTSYFGVPGDAAAVDYLVGLVGQGWTYEMVAALFLGSTEFRARVGGTNAALVDAVSWFVLGRLPDAAAKAFLVGHLDAGLHPYWIAFALLSSGEAHDRVVSMQYQSVLHRAARPDELAFWRPLFGSGLRQEQVLAYLVGSDEYLAAGT